MAEAKRGKGTAIVRYFKETKAELKKVSWPGRKEAMRLTAIVLAITALMAVLLGFIDYLFIKLFDLIIR